MAPDEGRSNYRRPHPTPLPLAGEGLSPIRRVNCDIARDFAFPAIAVGEQTILVVVQFFARLGGELEIRAFDDRVHGTGLLAHAAIDALYHIDVIASGAARAVVAARSSLDRNRLRGTDRLAELASDATFLAVGIAAECVFAAKARRKRRFLIRVVERRLRLEYIAHGKGEGGEELAQEQRARG